MSDCITLSNAVALLWRLSFAVVFLSASGWSYGIDETLEGWQVEYFADGQRRSEGEYQHGQRTGFWFYYHQNGEKVADGALYDAKQASTAVINEVWKSNQELLGENHRDQKDG